MRSGKLRSEIKRIIECKRNLNRMIDFLKLHYTDKMYLFEPELSVRVKRNGLSQTLRALIVKNIKKVLRYDKKKFLKLNSRGSHRNRGAER